jgi:hypothetical protein
MSAQTNRRYQLPADRQWTNFVAAKRRELTGLEAIVDAEGNMLGGTYKFGTADTADFDAAMSMAAAPRGAEHEDAHAAAIFGAPSKLTCIDGQSVHGGRDSAEPSSRHRRGHEPRSRDRRNCEGRGDAHKPRHSAGQGRERLCRDDEREKRHAFKAQERSKRDRDSKEWERCAHRHVRARDQHHDGKLHCERHTFKGQESHKHSQEGDRRGKEGTHMECGVNAREGEGDRGVERRTYRRQNEREVSRENDRGREQKAKREPRWREHDVAEGDNEWHMQSHRSEKARVLRGNAGVRTAQHVTSDDLGGQGGSRKHKWLGEEASDREEARWTNSKQDGRRQRHDRRDREACLCSEEAHPDTCDQGRSNSGSVDARGSVQARRGAEETKMDRSGKWRYQEASDGGGCQHQCAVNMGDAESKGRSRHQGEDDIDTEILKIACRRSGKSGDDPTKGDVGLKNAQRSAAVRLDAAMKEAMDAVPEGATVVLEEERREEEGVLQHDDLDSSFVQAAGGSWRERMQKKMLG